MITEIHYWYLATLVLTILVSLVVSILRQNFPVAQLGTYKHLGRGTMSHWNPRNNLTVWSTTHMTAKWLCRLSNVRFTEKHLRNSGIATRHVIRSSAWNGRPGKRTSKKIFIEKSPESLRIRHGLRHEIFLITVLALLCSRSCCHFKFCALLVLGIYKNFLMEFIF